MIRRGRDFDAQRAAMVERQLRRREIRDERVLAAMGAVPRELFVPDEVRRRAYADAALPIGLGQTISQPWIVAAICQGLRLEGSERVLDVGAGSGYSTAVLAHLCERVVGIERFGELAGRAKERLTELGLGNVGVIEGDGSVGYPPEAPYSGIAVHATAPGPPPSLIDQLAPDARLVMPVASHGFDMLTVFHRPGEAEVDASTAAGLDREVIGPCRFVPLIGDEGFADD